LLTCLFWMSPGAPAQAPDDSQTASGAQVRRLTFGARFGILPANLVESGSISNSTEDPVWSESLTTNPTSSHLGFGGTVEYALKPRWSLVADILHRRPSYRSGSTTIDGEDDFETEEDERLITETYEQTEATHWDVPVMLRYYESDRDAQLARYFLGAGVTLRYTGNVKSYRELTSPDGSVTPDNTPIDPAHRTALGAVVGAGFEFGKDRGFKIVPEVRYTRWLQPAFDAPPTRSNPDQVEFMVGITF
jgi:hypothetical protein